MNKYLATLIGVAAIAAYSIAPLAHAEAKQDPSMDRVVMQRDGGIRIQGASVTSVSSSTVQVSSLIGNTTLSWLIQLQPGTTFTGNGQRVVSLSDIATGDVVDVRGTLAGTGSVFTVNAKTIHASKVRTPAQAIMGTVILINGTSSTFSIQSAGRTVLVQVASSTKIIARNGTPVAFSAVNVGTPIAVHGTVSSDSSSIAAASIVVGSSTPNQPHRDDRGDREDHDTQRGRGTMPGWFGHFFPAFHGKGK